MKSNNLRTNRRPRKNQPYRSVRSGERRVVNTRASTGFPDSEIATLRYADEITISPGAHTGQYTFRGNSCFDPDESGVGHQPIYFDQYATVYSKYKVISSKMKLTCTNYDTSAVTVILLPSSEIVTATSYSLVMEQPYAKRTELLPAQTHGGVRTSVSSGMSTCRILGLSRSQFASEDYSATTGASPSSTWYWNIAAVSTSNLTVTILVDIEYKVLFYDRRSISLSYTLRSVKSAEELRKIEKEKENNGHRPCPAPPHIRK